MSASEQKEGGGSPAYNACFAALRTNKFKIKPSSGKVAVFYAGHSKSGAIWKTLKQQQQKYLDNNGVKAPFELVTDALARLDVSIEGRAWKLGEAMLNGAHFGPDEAGDLWDMASASWAQNSVKIFVWKGSAASERDLTRTPILDAIELPVLMLQNKQLTALNQRQIETALARTRKGESLDAELFRLEREFCALGQALASRHKLMTKYHWRDGLSVVWH